MSNLKRVLIIELLWPQSRAMGNFGAVIPPNKAVFCKNSIPRLDEVCTVVRLSCCRETWG